MLRFAGSMLYSTALRIGKRSAAGADAEAASAAPQLVRKFLLVMRIPTLPRGRSSGYTPGLRHTLPVFSSAPASGGRPPIDWPADANKSGNRRTRGQAPLPENVRSTRAPTV